jgi:hypothetical protein
MTVQKLLPRLTLNRQFAEDFLEAKAPCFALGMIEERHEALGLMALRPPQAIPQEVLALGFNFGHTLIGNDDCEIVRFFFEFYGYATYEVLLNPNNSVVRTVLSQMVATGEYFFLAIAPDMGVSAFRSELGSGNLTVLQGNWGRLQHSRTDDLQYQRAVKAIQMQVREPDALLTWVCRDSMEYLDVQHDPMELTPRGAQAPSEKGHAERLAIARMLNAKVLELEAGGVKAPLDLLSHMYPYMEIFHQLMQSAQTGEMDSLCRGHPGLHRFVRILEILAQGINSGEIKVPR